MFSKKNKATKLVSKVEEALLDGEKFPWGRAYNPEEERKNLKFAVPKIVHAYHLLKSLSRCEKELLERVFYLARDVDHSSCNWALEYAVKNGWMRETLKEIAREGRHLSLSKPKTVEARLRQAKLFNDGSWTYAAQIRDPKRGCSASVCSNCDEPLAFADYKCKVCNYELIGAHGMPTMKEWKNMDLEQKLQSLKEGYTHMRVDIHNRGDWRDRNSPLNRFKGVMFEWGSYSPVSGGAPLTRITGME